MKWLLDVYNQQLVSTATSYRIRNIYIFFYYLAPTDIDKANNCKFLYLSLIGSIRKTYEYLINNKIINVFSWKKLVVDKSPGLAKKTRSLHSNSFIFLFQFFLIKLIALLILFVLWTSQNVTFLYPKLIHYLIIYYVGIQKLILTLYFTFAMFIKVMYIL